MFKHCKIKGPIPACVVLDSNAMMFMQFLETGPELANNYTEVIAPQDVGTYGGLCALASFDRTELKAFYCFLIYSCKYFLSFKLAVYKSKSFFFF